MTGPPRFTRAESAAMLGCSLAHFDAFWRPKLHTAATTGTGKTLRFDSRAILEAYATEAVKRAVPDATEGDPEMVGPSSPALERFREARAVAAEMDLAERRRETVRLDVVKEWFPLVFGFVRRAGERLQKRFGAEAGKILNEELENADRAVVEHIGDDSPDGGRG